MYWYLWSKNFFRLSSSCTWGYGSVVLMLPSINCVYYQCLLHAIFILYSHIFILQSRVPVYATHNPAGTSVQNMIHWSQVGISGAWWEVVENQHWKVLCIPRNRKYAHTSGLPSFQCPGLLSLLPVLSFLGQTALHADSPNSYGGLPWWLSGKESACCSRRHRFDPWVGKIPWRRAWQPTSVFLPGGPPWTDKPAGLQSPGSQRVGHDWATKHTEHFSINPWTQFIWNISGWAAKSIMDINESLSFNIEFWLYDHISQKYACLF